MAKASGAHHVSGVKQWKASFVTAERNEADDLFQRLFVKQRFSLLRSLALFPRKAAHFAIRGYQLSLSMLVGRHCRHWPSCSAYTDEAILRHGLWRGGWVGLARICRCNPWGTSGVDIVCEALPPDARWYRPWSYGRWRGTNVPAAFDSDAEPATGGGTHPSHS